MRGRFIGCFRFHPCCYIRKCGLHFRNTFHPFWGNGWCNLVGTYFIRSTRVENQLCKLASRPLCKAWRLTARPPEPWEMRFESESNGLLTKGVLTDGEAAAEAQLGRLGSSSSSSAVSPRTASPISLNYWLDRTLRNRYRVSGWWYRVSELFNVFIAGAINVLTCGFSRVFLPVGCEYLCTTYLQISHFIARLIGHQHKF